MPMTEDLAVFLEPEEHGTTVALDGEDVNGILNTDVFHEVDGMGSTEPTFLCSAADAAAVVEDQSILDDGTTQFTVKLVQLDGTGLALLRLERPRP